ncbi:hypothetical protein L211DRAFT_852542 [Terfezia boudieri ATCC MYA-4762]|uniref:Uncharacterized protein n=1 Tax=Terfezia boudieri ATCC MYA-4762 TaxID=1051890 RepID=A0A3N4LF85_9PEZI|nr:hypothetical protein L211DRAFT_852542 [Terfezia boudieri ATCC MYA-4762]
MRREKLSSDHWAIKAEIECEEEEVEQGSEEKEVVDWGRLEKIVESLEKEGKESEERWYRGLQGDTPYKKLQALRAECSKKLKIIGWSKRWWDEELSAQLRITRRSRRENLGEELTQEARARRWKAQKEKLRGMIRQKKRECWQAFCEEKGAKDPWDIVKWAKDPWHLRQHMKGLADAEGRPLLDDNDKAKGLIRDHFSWKEDGRKLEEEGKEEESEEENEGGRTHLDEREAKAIEGWGRAVYQDGSENQAR